MTTTAITAKNDATAVHNTSQKLQQKLKEEEAAKKTHKTTNENELTSYKRN